MVLAAKCVLCGVLIEGLTRQHVLAAWRGKEPVACRSCAPVPIYTDGTHLVTSGPDKLVHDLAGEIGLRREWFKNNGSYPHYDLTSNKKVIQAIQHGAVRVGPKELVSIMQSAGKGLRRHQV